MKPDDESLNGDTSSGLPGTQEFCGLAEDALLPGSNPQYNGICRLAR